MFLGVVSVVLAVIFVMRTRRRPTPAEAPAPAAAPPAARVTEAPARPAPAAVGSEAGRSGEGERWAMQRLRGLAGTDPDAALTLAHDLARRFPSSAQAEEREALAIDALVAKGEIGRARADAEDFLERHPTGPRAEHVERLTGVHPHPRSDP